MTSRMEIAKPIFESRRDAGRQLAAELKEYRGFTVVVLAIPNGGVPVGLEVATTLKASFDVIISRKIPLPFHPEAGFGAITDDGTIILNKEVVSRFGLTEAQIEYEAGKVKANIKKRSMLYRGDRPLLAMGGKTVVVVDDGLASGFTMLAAVESVRRRHPREIIAAVPVASEAAFTQVQAVVDKVVACAIGAMPSFAVADFYQNWHDLNADQVSQALWDWRVQHSRQY